MEPAPAEQPLIDPADLVEVYRTTNRSTADIIAAALQAEGIRCYVEGDNQVFSGVLDITLEVPAQHADRAIKFIEQHEESE